MSSAISRAGEPQSFANHVRIVPGFHYGVLERIRSWRADHLRA